MTWISQRITSTIMITPTIPTPPPLEYISISLSATSKASFRLMLRGCTLRDGHKFACRSVSLAGYGAGRKDENPPVPNLQGSEPTGTPPPSAHLRAERGGDKRAVRPHVRLSPPRHDGCMGPKSAGVSPPGYPVVRPQLK